MPYGVLSLSVQSLRLVSQAKAMRRVTVAGAVIRISHLAISKVKHGKN